MSDQKTLSRQAWAELILLGLIWGGSFLSIRIALDEVSVLASVFYRTALAALALWIWIAFARLSLPKSPAIWASMFVMGVLNNVVPFSLMAWGQLYIESGLTSILNATTAVFGVLVAALFFADERLTPRKSIGVGLGLMGVVICMGVSRLAQLDLRSLAQLAVLLGALSYALAGCWARVRLAGLHPAIAAAGMLSGSTLILLPVLVISEGAPAVDLSPRTLWAIAYYALIATAGAYLLYYRVLATAGAGNLLIVTLIIPPIAIVLGAIVLGERLTLQDYIGFAVLALGLLIISGRIALPGAIDRTSPSR